MDVDIIHHSDFDTVLIVILPVKTAPHVIKQLFYSVGGAPACLWP